MPDGSGLRVGLGSRVTVEDTLTLYAQWAEWTPADRFTYELSEADACFTGCAVFSTLYINAIEDPYGFSYRRESVLADKVDLLIETMGEDRII